MIKDAVNKWNHLVPENRAIEFWGDFDLLKTKLMELPNYDEFFKEVIEQMELADAHSTQFLELGVRTKMYLDKNFIQISRSLIHAIVHRDQDEKHQVFKKIKRLTRQFQISFNMDKVFEDSTSSSKESVRLVEDALLAIDRIMPERKLAPSGTLIIRDLVSVNHMSVTKSDLEKMVVKFKSLYKIRVTTSAFGPTSVCLVPLCHYVSDEVISEIYGLTLCTMTVRDLTKLDTDELEWFVREDPNISITAITSKVIGSAVTSLSTVVCDLVSWMTQVYLVEMRSRNESPSIEECMEINRVGPWAHVQDTMLFMSPIELYRSLNKSDVPSIRIQEDFKVMRQLLELYQIQVSNYEKVDLRVQSSAPQPSAPSKSISEDRFYPRIRTSQLESFDIPGPTKQNLAHMKDFIYSIYLDRGRLNLDSDQRNVLEDVISEIQDLGSKGAFG
jgi:CRISPR/Cas system-associated exonuclease Cas4 (RecB family)